MKLKEIDNVFDYDIYITAADQKEKKEIKVIPINNFLRGSTFIMNLSIVKIDVWPDMCGLIAWMDMPGEMMSGLIKYNDGFYLSLEWKD